jgi:hypothetical protein
MPTIDAIVQAYLATYPQVSRDDMAMILEAFADRHGEQPRISLGDFLEKFLNEDGTSVFVVAAQLLPTHS